MHPSLKTPELSAPDWRALIGVLRCCAYRRKPSPQMRRKQAALLRAVADLPWDDLVLGYAIAEKKVDGAPSGVLSIRFYVPRKVSRTRLKTAWRIPRELRLESGQGKRARSFTLETDVSELSRIPEAQRTVRPGDSIGHIVGTSGVIGLMVDHAKGRFILSCSHVLAPTIANVGDAVESPADRESVAGPNTVGQLVSRTVFQPGLQHDMDAALARPAGGVTLTNANLPLSRPPRFANVTALNIGAYLDHPVIRVALGASQAGVFDSIENNVPVAMMGDVFRFSGIYAYLAPNQDGDSCAPVVDRITGEVLGLHFAGRPDLNKGWIIPGSTIARRLGVRVAPV
jgi:hypothetical protein